jgi:hypothetical protein
MDALQARLKKSLRKWSKINKATIRFVAPYAKAHKDVQPVVIANIATVLGPKLDKVLEDNSHLSVVGYDGAALAKKGYPWRRKIAKWLKWGCSVDYFLYAPAPAAIKALSQISNKVPEGKGRLRVFRPKNQRDLSPKFRCEIPQLKTFHFVVSRKPLTLWIETNHQTSEPKAFDCYFFPESAATETGLGETYANKFERIINQASLEIPLSRNNFALKSRPKQWSA